MGNVPVIHEIRTVIQSFIDQISLGHSEIAHERWDKYFNESFLVRLFRKDTDKAFQLVPSHDVTAKKLTTNFLHIDPVNERFPAHEPKDIVVVMDGSTSLGSDEFNKGKTALKTIMELGRHGGNDTKYAAVTFSKSAVVNFPFLPYTEAANKISTIPYLDGGTSTGAGLKEAMKLLDDPSSGRRINATKIVLLVTDGLSRFEQRFAKAVDKLKNSGVKIFVLAVGTYQVNGIDELAKGASSPPEQFLFRVESLESFLHVVLLVVKEVNSSLYHVPPHSVTATKLITNFLRIDPVNKQYPRHDAKDIVVVMEESASIGSNEFNEGKAALKNMIGLEREGGNDTKYAAITLSDSSVVNFVFLPYAEAADEITNVHARLAELEHPSGTAGGSNIQAGLKGSKKLFDDPLSGGRFNATKMIFLVIDGQTNLEKHLTEVEVLKNSGVQIFAVAVGSSIDSIDKIANAISSPPEKFLFRVESLKGFFQVVELAVEQVYSSFYYVVPHPSVTATKLITNFLRNDPVNNDAKDIVVIMDGSASIGKDDFNKGMTALKSIIGSLREGENDTKYAAVTFSNSVRVNFSFLPWQLAENQILKLPYPASRDKTHASKLAKRSNTFVEPSSADGSNILAALMEVKELFDDPSSGCRIDATKMAFLLIDGQSNFEEYLTEADVLKNMGVKIFVVALGSCIDGSSKIVNVASSPPEQFFFRVESLVGFLDVVELANDHKELYENSAAETFCGALLPIHQYLQLNLENIKEGQPAQKQDGIR